VKFGVSVYIPNRNHAATLGAAIYSAASQSPVEVAVIDDASTDDSMAVADAAAMTHDCVWVLGTEGSGRVFAFRRLACR